MKSASLLPLLTALLLAPPARAQLETAPALQPPSPTAPRLQWERGREAAWRQGAAGSEGGELGMASRSMLWLGRGAQPRWQLGLGVQREPGQLLQEWVAGVSVRTAPAWRWTLEAPLPGDGGLSDAQRGLLRFERNREAGPLGGMRATLRVSLSANSQLVIKPRRSRSSITYVATW